MLVVYAEAAPLRFETAQGKASLSGFAYWQPLRGFNNFGSTAEIEASSILKNDSWGFKLTPWLKANFPDDRAASSARIAYFPDAKEAWGEYLADNWDFRFGNQLLAWGTTDGINPTDIWNAWDMTDPFNPLKLPTLAAKLSVHPLGWENVTLDLVGVPRFRRNRLPVHLANGSAVGFGINESRWLQNIPTKVRLGEDNSLPLAYVLEPSSEPDRWEAGARLRFLRINGWDFSLSGGEIVAKTPQVNFKTQGSLTPPDFTVTATLSPAYYRLQSLGFDAAGSFRDIGLRMEAAFRRPVGAGGEGVARTFIGIAGVDYTVPGKFLGANVYLNLSYAHKEQSGGAWSTFTAGIPDIEPWDRTLLLVTELQWNQKYYVGLRSVKSLAQAGDWLRPYARATWDSVSAEIYADWFGGNRLGALGQFAENKRAGAAASVAW